MAVQIDYVSDWAARLKSRLYEQFKDKARLVALVEDVYAPQVQELEDAMQSLLSLPSIEEGEGAQLDVIGVLVGQERAGADDATYRLRLRARVRANRSSGTHTDIYGVFFALFGNPDLDAEFIHLTGDIVEFVFRINEVITSDDAALSVDFLGDSTAAGDRPIFEWQETADALAFSFASGPGLGFDDAASPGAGGALVGAAEAS